MKLEEARKEAKREGAEERNRLFVANLLASTSHSVAKIAALAGVTEAYNIEYSICKE
jgi:hypothetical protein